MKAQHKVAVILGTRPEAIKLAPVVLALNRDPAFSCRVCVTGQHREMVDQVLPVFGIKPDTDLNLMKADQTLGQLTARLMDALDGYLSSNQPDLVLVQGDTTTVFCAALAAFYRQIPLGHVEAGLRTWDLNSPWPEEANRVLTSRLAALHFAPTHAAERNLRAEGVARDRIVRTGNTVIDAVLLARERVRRKPPMIPGLPWDVQPNSSGPQLVLITGHRRESFGPGLQRVCEAVLALAQRFPDAHFVYPVHLNPNVRAAVVRTLTRRRTGGDGQGLASRLANVHLLEPLAYLPFVALMDRANLILTDSGGIQEEAPTLGKPVLVMRDTTERPEGVRTGLVQMVGTDKDRIVEAATQLLCNPPHRQRVPKSPYGDGHAAERIVQTCREFLAGSDRRN